MATEGAEITSTELPPIAEVEPTPVCLDACFVALAKAWGVPLANLASYVCEEYGRTHRPEQMLVLIYRPKEGHSTNQKREQPVDSEQRKMGMETIHETKNACGQVDSVIVRRSDGSIVIYGDEKAAQAVMSPRDYSNATAPTSSSGATTEQIS